MAKVILYKLPADTNGNVLNFYTAADSTVDTEATNIQNNGAFTDGTVVTYAIQYTTAEVNPGGTAMLSPGGAGTVLFGQMTTENAQVLIKSYAKALANGNNDDIASIATANFVRLTGPTGVFAVRGIASGADGVTLTIFNDTSQTMTISDQNAGSVAANRIITGTGADLAFTGNSAITFIYSGEKARWVLSAVSELPAGVGTGSVTTVSVVTANGVSGTVATATSTPAITLTVQNAVADGATKGIAAFTAADFDAAAGVISIDYANGQAASGAVKGFLTAANWSTFNNKISAKMSVSGGVRAQAQSATRYHSFTGPISTGTATDPTDVASTEYFYAWQAPYAGTVKNLFALVNVAPAAGQTFAITIMKNGAAQTLTCTVTDAGRTASDAVNTFAVVAGDVIAIRGVTSATSGTMNGNVAVEFLAT